MNVVGQILGGDFSEIIVRQKNEKEIEIGDLFVADTKDGFVILQSIDIMYGSQIGSQSRELIAGMKLEGYEDLTFMNDDISNYMLAKLKPVLFVSDGKERIPKRLPLFFSSIRPISENELSFLTKPLNPILFGKIRSGSKILNVDIYLDGKSVLKHHVLIAATTGRGKSNLVKNLLWSALENEYCSFLVLDPHDEYFGRNTTGLKDHEKKVSYYSINPIPGASSLKINLEALTPYHFEGVLSLSGPQTDALTAFYNKYKEKWIENLILMDINLARTMNLFPETLAVLQRRFNVSLGIQNVDGQVACKGIFDRVSGRTTIADICRDLENCISVVVDTSMLSSELELLIGSMISKEILERYKRCKLDGTLEAKPVVSVILEEAPRVLSQEAIKTGNIFATIAREGRKFNVGLIAITQLPSLIPKEILANMNTKIILGLELAAERNAIIESASQDLSKDDRHIASLDRGEAIITSNFTKFAVPLHIPLFEPKKKDQIKRSFNF